MFEHLSVVKHCGLRTADVELLGKIGTSCQRRFQKLSFAWGKPWATLGETLGERVLATGIVGTGYQKNKHAKANADDLSVRGEVRIFERVRLLR